MKRGARIAALIILGVLVPQIAVGTTFAPTTIDRLLLEPTTIAFASIFDIRESNSTRGVEVVLGDISCVSGDCDADRLQLPIANFDPTHPSVRPFPHQPSLRVGRRYLFFLTESVYGQTLVSFYPSIYEVKEDDTIACAGGSIYGLTAIGLYCSKAQYQFGRPLGEKQLLTLLIREQDAARRRRPFFKRSVPGQHQQAIHANKQGVRR